MKAALLVEPRKLIIEEVPAPSPGPEDVLIRILLGGICGSDHTLYHGGFDVPLPVIPGHEAIGRVEEIGAEVTGFKVGQRVVVQPNIGCGGCRQCRVGQKNLCSSKIRLGLDRNGLFAEFAVVPAEYAWPVPVGLEDEDAVFTEPLAVSGRAEKHMLVQNPAWHGQERLVCRICGGAGRICLAGAGRSRR